MMCKSSTWCPYIRRSLGLGETSMFGLMNGGFVVSINEFCGGLERIIFK